MNRRSFVASSLLFAASACLAADAPGGPVRSAPRSSQQDLPPWLDSLLRDAARAPSSHNSQPWTLAFQSERRWRLRLARTRRLATVDPHDREAWISLGAFCAALETSASARGLRPEFSETDAADDSIDIALGACPPDGEWLASLRTRRCLRRDLVDVAVPPQLWQGASANRGTTFRWLPLHADEARLISAYTVEAEIVQHGMDAVWRELADWIRWSATAERRTPTGLTPAGMELPLPVRLWVAARYGRDDVMARDFRLRSLQACRRYVDEGAGWLAIATTADDRAAWLEAGRALQRVWLAATRSGLALHPMSQALEVPSVRERLTRHLGLGPLQLLLRIGQPSRMRAPVSPRLAPAQFVLSSLAQGEPS